jgi:hypothetical protein
MNIIDKFAASLGIASPGFIPRQLPNIICIERFGFSPRRLEAAPREQYYPGT